jgi:tetratricopeptide (TPR) repeat protein
MRAYLLSLGLLAVMAFCLSATLEPWFHTWQGSRTQSANVVQVALGDSRRLFASHFFSKADAYFHNGYYPSIYYGKESVGGTHMANGVHQDGEQVEAEADFLGAPKDWLDQFSRNFYPTRHSHLGDSKCADDCCDHAKAGQGHDENCEHKDHDEDHHAESGGAERELLPWLRLSAELDPQRAETYVVASYWLRSKLKKLNEAEQFLRLGLQANPGDPSILLELGRIYYEDRKNVSRGRNVLELALQSWRQREAGKPEPDRFLLIQILNHLALLEREQHNSAKAIEHLTVLKQVSPNPDRIQVWIDQLRTNAPAGKAPQP